MGDIWKAFKYGVGAILGVFVVNAAFGLFEPDDEDDFAFGDASVEE